MRNLLIGSRALDYWHDVGLVKNSTDWDVISTEPIDGTEWHNPLLLNNSLFEYYTNDNHTIDFNGTMLHVVNLEGLAIIKRSHLWRDLGFGKHITMYHKHLARYLKPSVLLKQRTMLTLKAYPQQGPNLKKTVEDFFDDAVDKKYSHDWLHELYAFEDKPMYTKMQTNPELAWCDRLLWNNFTHEQKIHTVQEETYVIATERFLVPKDFKYPSKLAYNKALNKVCTTLCSGWFRDFAIDNYPEILNNFDDNKVKQVQNILKAASKAALMKGK